MTGDPVARKAREPGGWANVKRRREGREMDNWSDEHILVRPSLKFVPILCDMLIKRVDAFFGRVVSTAKSLCWSNNIAFSRFTPKTPLASIG